jgi:hypothetical protein
VSLTSAAKLRQQDSTESDVEDPTLESIIPNVENSRKVFACHFPLKNSQLESWMAKAPQAMEKQSSNDHLPKSDFVFLTFNSDGILTLFKVVTSGVVVKSNTYGKQTCQIAVIDININIRSYPKEAYPIH